MYSTPPTLLHANALFTNVGQNFIIVAGVASMSIRVSKIHACLPRNAAAGVFEGIMTEGGGGTQRIGFILQQPNQWAEYLTIDSPGWQLPINTDLVCNGIATIAGPTSIRLDIVYYMDVVT